MALSWIKNISFPHLVEIFWLNEFPDYPYLFFPVFYKALFCSSGLKKFTSSSILHPE